MGFISAHLGEPGVPVQTPYPVTPWIHAPSETGLWNRLIHTCGASRKTGDAQPFTASPLCIYDRYWWFWWELVQIWLSVLWTVSFKGLWTDVFLFSLVFFFLPGHWLASFEDAYEEDSIQDPTSADNFPQQRTLQASNYICHNIDHWKFDFHLAAVDATREMN